MSRHPIVGPTRTEREIRAHNLHLRAAALLRDNLIDWSVDPPVVVFTPDLTGQETAFFATLPFGDGPDTRIVGVRPTPTP